MTVRVSTDLSNSMLSQYGFSAMMEFGAIYIYSGTQPDSASLAPTGDLLGIITTDGNVFTPGELDAGLQVELGESGGLINAGSWVLRGSADGEAGWWRWKWNALDDDSVSLYYPRMDGAVGESLVLAVTTIQPTTNIEIDSFYLNFLE